MTQESNPDSHSEDQSRPEWVRKLGRKVGAVAIAGALALTATFVVKELDNHDREKGHPKQVENIHIDESQRHKIDSAASVQAKHLLQPDSTFLDVRKVTQGEATITEDGKLSVVGQESINKSSGSRRGTIDSKLIFEGAPAATDPASVVAYLESDPHVVRADMTQADAPDILGGGRGYELSVDITNDTMTITSPEDVGADGQKYTVDKPLEDYYALDPVARAGVVASGIQGIYLF